MELKPCPFCGGRPTVEREENDDWLVWCRCGCVLAAFGASDEAEEAWNHRVSDDLKERMEDDGK